MTHAFTPATLAAVLLLGAAPAALAQQVQSPNTAINKSGLTPAGPSTQTLEGAEAVRAAIAAGGGPAGASEAAPVRQAGNAGPAVLTQQPPSPRAVPASRRTKSRRAK